MKDLEADEESTTVDHGPPEPEVGDSSDRWEEKTHREGVGARPPPKVLRRRLDPLEDSGEILRDTIERGSPSRVEEEDEEPTVRADEHQFASGTGEVGMSTVDEPTVEDHARPLPPLAPMPSYPQGKLPRKMTARSASAAAGRLAVIAGNDSGREFELIGGRLVVGRAIDCDVVLTDIAVSRKHLELSYENRLYTLRDLGSGNGTLINDRLEDGAFQLQHGDRLELGNTVIRFEHPGSKAEHAVIGFGDQVEVDEEASTLAGRRRSSPQPLSAKLLESVQDGEQPPAPAAGAPLALSDLGLPASPPGAEMAANAPHAPLVASPTAQPIQPTIEQREAPPTDVLPPASNAIALGPPPLFANNELLLPVRRNRIVIGLISATLAVVLLAIAATILRGGDEETAFSSSTKSSGMPGKVDDGTPAKSKAAKPADTKPSKEPDKAKPPTRKLPRNTWGTNEILLAARTNGLLSRSAPPRGKTADTKRPAAPAKVTPKPSPVHRTPEKKTKKHTGKPKAKPKAKPKKAKKAKKRAKPKPKRRVATRKKPERSSGTRSKAAALYRSKKFITAGQALRDAARSAVEKEAVSLRALAAGYEAVGTNLTKAKRTQSSNPTASMAAYRRALRLDKKAGNGAHATFIRLQLGRVAPKAAASYMAQRRYEAAKKAADAAVNYGAGSDPTVRRVRKALERKAGNFYKAAAKQRKKKPATAKKLLRRVIKMVPADSPWYIKAYKLLNARSKARDDDE